MGHRVFSISVVYVIRDHQFNPGLLRHFQELLINQRLIRQTVILEFKKIVVLAEDVPVLQSCLLRLVIESLHNITLDFTSKACTQSYNPVVILSEQFFIHAGTIIVSLDKTL